MPVREVRLGRRRETSGRNYPEIKEGTLSSVVEALQSGPITERELANAIGNLRSAPYIQKLRNDGWNIETTRVEDQEMYVLRAYPNGIAANVGERMPQQVERPHLRVVNDDDR